MEGISRKPPRPPGTIIRFVTCLDCLVVSLCRCGISPPLWSKRANCQVRVASVLLSQAGSRQWHPGRALVWRIGRGIPLPWSAGPLSRPGCGFSLADWEMNSLTLECGPTLEQRHRRGGSSGYFLRPSPRLSHLQITRPGVRPSWSSSRHWSTAT